MIFKDYNTVDYNKITCNTTEIFNTGKYGSKTIANHYGVYYTETLAGTDNIIGLNILLVHTDHAYVQPPQTDNSIDLTEKTETQSISQDITFDLVEDIANMLTAKYGKPADTLHSADYTSFYVIQGSEIKDYKSDTSNVGDLLVWRTKYLNIEFFKGLLSYKSSYLTNFRTYENYDSPLQKIEVDKITRPCKSYCYISYRLNNATIKKMGLDNVKL